MAFVSGRSLSLRKCSESGIIAWDCKNMEEVLLDPYGLFLAGDNPMQAEECSHAGLACNLFCRTCDVGGTKEFKQSDEGYATIFKVSPYFIPKCLCTADEQSIKSGQMRTPEDTNTTILKQLQLSTQSGGTEKVKKSTTATGISDASSASVVQSLLEMGKTLRKRGAGRSTMTELDIQKILEDELVKYMKLHPINPLIGMPGMFHNVPMQFSDNPHTGVDIFQDTPTEILHTVLLGVVKYFWAQTVFVMGKNKTMERFEARLGAIDQHGLNIPKINAEYICQYKGGLIGKHFKSLAQVMSFLVYDLIPPIVLTAWNIIGRLCVLLWHTKINDIELYLVQSFHRYELLN